jgi:hypothetical protein
MAAVAVSAAAESFPTIVAGSALISLLDLLHGDDFGTLPHDRKDAVAMACAAFLLVRFPLKEHQTGLAVGIIQ